LFERDGSRNSAGWGSFILGRSMTIRRKCTPTLDCGQPMPGASTWFPACHPISARILVGDGPPFSNRLPTTSLRRDGSGRGMSAWMGHEGEDYEQKGAMVNWYGSSWQPSRGLLWPSRSSSAVASAVFAPVFDLAAVSAAAALLAGAKWSMSRTCAEVGRTRLFERSHGRSEKWSDRAVQCFPGASRLASMTRHPTMGSSAPEFAPPSHSFVSGDVGARVRHCPRQRGSGVVRVVDDDGRDMAFSVRSGTVPAQAAKKFPPV